MNNKKVLKFLGIKQIKNEFSRNFCMTFYGFIPLGYAKVNERKIYVKNGTRKEVFVHEVMHVLMGHNKQFKMYDKVFLTQEIEAEMLSKRICKTLNLKFREGNLKNWKKMTKKNKFNIKIRTRKMEQVYNKFLEAVRS